MLSAFEFTCCCCPDPRIESTSYWSYSINELGEKDIGAQVDHIHVVKCAELGAAKHIHPEDFGCVDPGSRRSSVDLLTVRSLAVSERLEEVSQSGRQAGVNQLNYYKAANWLEGLHVLSSHIKAWRLDGDCR
eukprot:scaffold152693_cov36-Prasinocladus_malaysianus.AAC.1